MSERNDTQVSKTECTSQESKSKKTERSASSNNKKDNEEETRRRRMDLHEKIGKKTRELGLIEKKKRKEIVWLKHDDGQIQKQQRYGNAGKKRKNTKIDQKLAPGAKRKKKATQKITNGKRRKINNLPSSTDDDSWIPIISHLNDTGVAKSTIVRIHGLPRGKDNNNCSCKKDQIRQFFSGLEPKRVFMLPKFDHFLFDLDGISRDVVDISGESNLRKELSPYFVNLSKPRFPRISDSSLRVFVQFDSIDKASLGVNRSGESLSKTKVSIGVTHVSKQIASGILKMAIDAKEGEFFTTTLMKVQNHLSLPPHDHIIETHQHHCLEKVLWSYFTFYHIFPLNGSTSTTSMNQKAISLRNYLYSQIKKSTPFIHFRSQIVIDKAREVRLELQDEVNKRRELRKEYKNLGKMHNHLCEMYDFFQDKFLISRTSDLLALHTHGSTGNKNCSSNDNNEATRMHKTQIILTKCAVNDIYKEISFIQERLKRIRQDLEN